MTAERGRLTLDGTWVSCPQPEPPHVATCTTRGGQPCPRLPHAASVWRSTKSRWRWPLSRRSTGPRSPPSAPSAPASGTSINAAASCHRRPHRCSSSLKPAPVAMGPTGSERNAQWVAISSASTLAVELRVSSPFSSRWREKRGASVRRMHTYLCSLRPMTKSDTLSVPIVPKIHTLTPRKSHKTEGC